MTNINEALLYSAKWQNSIMVHQINDIKSNIPDYELICIIYDWIFVKEILALKG